MTAAGSTGFFARADAVLCQSPVTDAQSTSSTRFAAAMTVFIAASSGSRVVLMPSMARSSRARGVVGAVDTAGDPSPLAQPTAVTDASASATPVRIRTRAGLTD